MAKTEWAAIKAAQALKVTWAKPTSKVPGTPDELFAYLRNTKPARTLKAGGERRSAKRLDPRQENLSGDLPLAVSNARHDRSVLLHRRRQRRQGNHLVRTARAVSHAQHGGDDRCGPKEQDVRIIYHEASGSYGRMSTDDGAEDAALLSRAVGAPVRVQWSRQDEHGWEPKGPAHFDEAKAAVDGDGKLIAWDFQDYSQPWTASGSTPLLLLCKSASADQSRRFQRHTEQRRVLRHQQSIDSRPSYQLAFSRADPPAHEQSARPWRHSALFRQRGISRRNRCRS